MASQNQQAAGAPPSRPPPPFHPSAPPPYMEPQGGMPQIGQAGGQVPYGGPPPAGYYAPPPYQMAGTAPGGYQIPPNQMGHAPPGGGQSLYPDISELPQPQAVPVGFTPGGHPQPQPATNVPAGPPPVPVRPAPGPPTECGQTSPSGVSETPWWTKLKDGEAPPGCVISWKGGDGLNIYFIQGEGQIVSPRKQFEMTVYKKINGQGDAVEESLTGMVEVISSWRLRLHGRNSYGLHTYNDTYAFIDDSTCPSKSGRIVIIELPTDVSTTMRTDLLALLQDMADVREDQEGVVDKITTNVGAVYTDITKKINTVVKDTAPGAHKSTKWLRKGTGSLVRMGGNLVSKGMHLIADQMPVSQQPEQNEESPFHTELMEGLANFYKCKENATITYV